MIGDARLRRLFPLKFSDPFHWNVMDDVKRRLFAVAHLIDHAVPDGPEKSLAVASLEEALSACVSALVHADPDDPGRILAP